MDIQSIWKYDIFINENNPFVFNSEIVEYDMKEGGFSLIKEFNLLPKKEIDNLKKVGKQQRTIIIGKMQIKHPELREGLKRGFIQARRMFFEENNLERSDIISIKKDAIFTVKKCNHLQITENILFRPKNIYSSYINLGSKMELYYNIDRLDIKGMNDENMKSHDRYMISFIKQFINKMETEDNESVIRFLKRFIDKYKSLNLNIGYYRTFDHRSMYELKDSTELHEHYYDEDIQDIDISYNYFNILLKLVRILL